jgi:hypothetical protein
MPRHDDVIERDVRWDHGAAAAAIAALRRAADELEGVSADCGRAARVATAHWLGQHRLGFALRRRALDAEGQELAAECRAAAGAVATADRRAREEQARRERVREERAREERERRERERQRHAQPQI